MDEVGVLPQAAQAKLLRLVQEKTFTRVGGDRDRHLDTRIIAATNIDLDEAVENRAFRKDLYFRLSFFTLRIPPLSERSEDIPLLAKHFAGGQRMPDGRVFTLGHDALLFLERHEWKGNVRELKNTVEAACLLAEKPALTARDFGRLRPQDEDPITLKDARGAFERSFVVRVLRRHGGNKTRAADELGMTRQTLHRLIRAQKIEEREWN